MYRIVAFLILGLTFTPVFAQDSGDLENRLRAFNGAQMTCKASILSNKDSAASFLQSNSGTLSDMCECAAMIAVSSKSNLQIREIISSSDISHSAVFADEVNRALVQCIRMN